MIVKAGREAWRTMIGILYARVRARIEEAAATADISPGALRALSLLDPADGVAMRELADRWGCDASYITSLADDLERHGLVRRGAHPTDRRVKMLLITPAGLEVRRRAHEVLAVPPPSLAALTAEEQRQLRDLLAKMCGDEVDPPWPARWETRSP